MLAYVFPGQGSQKKGMGAELFNKYPLYVELADNILGYSIQELCLEDPENKLNSTEFAQVAIFIVNSLTYLYYVDALGVQPDYVAGHSLGEYSALFAANVFDFETGLKLVKMRGYLMSKVTGGAMAAVLGMSRDQVEVICKKYKELSIEIANYNTKTQTIISGDKKNIMKSREIFLSIEGVQFLPLNVSGAFHSSYMQVPKLEFEKYIFNFEFQKPEIPIIANLTAKEYEENKVAEYLVEQISSPVKWEDTIIYLLEQGVNQFIELGQGLTLTKMIETTQEKGIHGK